MTETINIAASISTAVFPCAAEGRLGLGKWALKRSALAEDKSVKFQLVPAAHTDKTNAYCLGAWVAQGVSNARLVSCGDPSATWAGMHVAPGDVAQEFHLVASAAMAASQPQAKFAATECLDACHKGECVRDASPTIAF
jgi:hypothetical protein